MTENLPQQERTPKMTELQQRALAVALREHQEEQRKAEAQRKMDAALDRILCAVLHNPQEVPN
jgi:hypothetical protein